MDGVDFESTTFESNMPFALRFMIDKDIVGMGWVRV
jgi:DNA polymerase elongation subunit (family B)